MKKAARKRLKTVEENKRNYLCQLAYGCSRSEAKERSGLTDTQLNKYRFEDKNFQWFSMTEEGKRVLREYAPAFLREDLIYLISCTIFEARKAMLDDTVELRKLMKLIGVLGVRELASIEKLILDKKKHHDTMSILTARLTLEQGKRTPLQLAKELRAENRQLQIVESTSEVIE